MLSFGLKGYALIYYPSVFKPYECICIKAYFPVKSQNPISFPEPLQLLHLGEMWVIQVNDQSLT